MENVWYNISMTREEYLKKRRAYYQLHKDQWAKYNKAHREEINKKSVERRKNKIEQYRATAKLWREKNKDKIHDYQEKYVTSEKGKKTRSNYYITHRQEYLNRAKSSRKLHQDEARVHSIVGNALSSGKLQKRPCEVCGNIMTDAHHDDYNKPLDVRWLCRKCHAEWHRHNEPIRATRERYCIYCGKKFIFTHGAQKICSNECREKIKKEYHKNYYTNNKQKWASQKMLG